jgi:hypothetical protein
MIIANAPDSKEAKAPQAVDLKGFQSKSNNSAMDSKMGGISSTSQNASMVISGMSG